jgi:hypothetical protein
MASLDYDERLFPSGFAEARPIGLTKSIQFNPEVLFPLLTSMTIGGDRWL